MLICSSSYHEERHVENGGGSNSLTLYDQRCSTTMKPGQQQSSPPSYSRLPPDGHEFPANYSENLHDNLSRFQSTEYEESLNPSSLPKTPKVSLSTADNNKRSASADGNRSASSRWRRQDERSEKSVRDKIAMFSSERAAAKNRRIHRSESVSGSSNEKVCMKRSLTEDDVRIQSSSNDSLLIRRRASPDQTTKRLTKPSVYSSMINVHSSDSESSKENVKPASSETDVRSRSSPKISRVESSLSKKSSAVDRTETKRPTPPRLNNRSQSLIDIGKTSKMKRHSVGAYDRPLAYKYGIEKPEERERRTSLTNMIEQRRKSISKLRGLVIPEARSGETNDRLPIDLPKIGNNNNNSNAAISSLKTMSLPRDDSSRSSRLCKADSISSIDSCSSSASRHSSGTNAIKLQKHSPANNRKSSTNANKVDSLPPLSYRLNRNQSPMSDASGPASTPRTSSPHRSSSERATTPSSDASFDNDSLRYTSNSDNATKSAYIKPNFSTTKCSYDSRHSNDSDNESVVSSTQSSFSQSLSPRASPMPDQYDADDRQSPMRSSRVHHSPQSSYDEIDHKRVLKSGSLEAENRRTILNSAKVSSGRSSSDEHSTPELVRKSSKDKKKEPTTKNFSDLLSNESSSKRFSSGLARKGSIESTTSSSSSLHSRRNSRDLLSPKMEPAYKESHVQVAHLNEIVDDYEEIKETTKETAIPKTSSSVSKANNVTVSMHEDTKWSALEQKYSKRNDHHESFENKMQKYKSSPSIQKNRSGVTTKQSNFRAVADKWKQRTEEDRNACQPNANSSSSNSSNSVNRRDSLTRSDVSSSSFKRDDFVDSAVNHSRLNRSFEESFSSTHYYEERPNSLNLFHQPDRKFSVPEYGSSLKTRDKREEVLSRPFSLIEGNIPLEQPNNQYLTSPLSPSSTSTDSRDELLLDSSDLSRTGSKEVLDAFSKPCLSSNNSPKISEILRAFERHDMSMKGPGGAFHPRMSSLDSTASDDGYQCHYGSVSSLTSGTRDQYGSITSLSSSTSIISPQELQQLIEEANLSLEESGTPSHEILVVVLHREIVGHGSIGITLAGGADYETKEITVHKVIPGSLSDRDGRIQKGDRVLSINGKTLRGVSHREALNILKSPRPEVVLVLSRSRSVTPLESTVTASNGDVDAGFSHRPVFINHVPPPRPPKILESPMDSKSLVSDTPCERIPRGPPMTIALMKDGAGLGFSLEGGKDSPLGDRPLTVKKVFSGGAADKGGILVVGDELLSVNSFDLTNMARIEAWNFLKKLPDGTVSLVIRKKLKEESVTN